MFAKIRDHTMLHAQRQVLLLLTVSISGVLMSAWKEWWTYDGIAGPEFWGVLNPGWTLCTSGKHQSPINIDPNKLVYDPNLDRLHVDHKQTSWIATNTGHDITISTSMRGGGRMTFSGGPLSYTFRVSYVTMHIGMDDSLGSEHTISGHPFPAEIQFVAYNSDLFRNFSDARPAPNSVAIVSVMVQIQDRSNPHLKDLLNVLTRIKYRGNSSPLPNFNASRLLPSTDTYFTYFGSFTQPACEEVVTWVVLNKPLYISKSQITRLRKLTKGMGSNSMVLMENNFRPTMPLHKRTVRTNVHLKSKDYGCVIKKVVEYKDTK